jgi:hypothetical protein
MKASPSKSMKTGGGKKRSRDEAARSAQGSTLPTSPPRPNPNKERKKSKAKTEDLLALVNMWTCGAPPREIHIQWRRILTISQCSRGSWSAGWLSLRATSSKASSSTTVSST